MSRNVGGADKAVRIVLGVVLLGVALLGSVGGTVQVILLIVGAIALITGLVGYCPLNRLLGVNTCKAG